MNRAPQLILTRMLPLLALGLLGASPGSCGGFDPPPELPPPPGLTCGELDDPTCVDAEGCILAEAGGPVDTCRCGPCPEGAVCVCGCPPPALSCVEQVSCAGLDARSCGATPGCAPAFDNEACACPGCVPGGECPPCDCRPRPPTYLGCRPVDACALLDEAGCEAAASCVAERAYPPWGAPCPEGEDCGRRGPPEPVFVGCRAAPEPPPQCGDVCTIWCEHGNVLDARGCPTCACNPPPEPPPECGPVCDIWCEHGNVLDARGCPTCQCNPAPGDACRTDADCAADERCEHSATCAAIGCPPPPPPRCVPR